MMICPFRECNKNSLARPFRWAICWSVGFLGGSDLVLALVLAPVLDKVLNLPCEFFYLINVDDILTFAPSSDALSDAHLLAWGR